MASIQDLMGRMAREKQIADILPPPDMSPAAPPLDPATYAQTAAAAYDPMAGGANPAGKFDPPPVDPGSTWYLGKPVEPFDPRVVTPPPPFMGNYPAYKGPLDPVTGKFPAPPALPGQSAYMGRTITPHGPNVINNTGTGRYFSLADLGSRMFPGSYF